MTATFKVDIPAGPLWNNEEAQKLGPAVAAAHFGKFTGQWNTVVEGQESVIQVELPTQPTGGSEYTMDVPAGPLWSNEDAKTKCPAICASYGGTWNGQWKTVVEGKMSVAGCTFKF
jgi:Mannan-binding protein